MSFDITDPFKKHFQDLNPGSKEDVFVKAKLKSPFGGLGGGGGAAPRKKEAEPEEEAIPLLAPQPKEEDKKEKIVLRNPKWEADDVGFNEETPVSVEVELPASAAHKQKVLFELYANGPQGPERISQADGMEEDGKATAMIPVYLPCYKEEDGSTPTKVEYQFTAKHSQSDLLKDEKAKRVVDHTAERMIKAHVLQDVTFGFDKSFVQAKNADGLKKMCAEIEEWKESYPEGKLAVFGHADAVGKEDYNKKLSEKRARAVHAFLVKDVKAWSALYDEEKWGLASTQDLLKHLGHYDGAVDGQDGPKTQAAVKSFREKAGLPPGASADGPTREALYKAFMDECNDLALKDKDFDAIDAKPHIGCSEFNLVEEKQGASEPNRRVAVFLLKSNKNFPITYPCKHGDVGPCKAQVAKKGERRTPGFKCLFYDKLVTESAGGGGAGGDGELPDYDPGKVEECDGGCGTDLEPPKEEDVTFEAAWEKPALVPWDASDDAAMKTKLKLTGAPDSEGVVLEIFQFAADGSHTSYRKIEGLKISGDALHGPDGKEVEIGIAWHDTIYDYGKTQYFCKLTVDGQEKDTGLTKEKLLHLKHFNGLIANPSGDLPGAATEGAWVNTYMKTKGPWLEATKSELVGDGHETKMHGAADVNTMKDLILKNKFIHHQSSHGTAYCTCDGNKNYYAKDGTTGADGVKNYSCPKCKKSTDGTGVIFLKDWNNLFFIETVKAMAHVPKVLVFANCCLTCSTSTYADAWNAKGTRWYIGWAVPVDDQPAVNFAKAFYQRWMEQYKMEPDKVKSAFNDVKGPYASYRPRIFGA